MQTFAVTPYFRSRNVHGKNAKWEKNGEMFGINFRE